MSQASERLYGLGYRFTGWVKTFPFGYLKRRYFKSRGAAKEARATRITRLLASHCPP